MEIETTRLRCRPPCPDDLEDLVLLVGDPEVMKHLGSEAGTILSREDAQIMLQKMIEFWSQHGFGRWAVRKKDEDKLIGLCGFRLLDSTPELFYLFAKEDWGKGLATEAASAVLKFGFDELGFERIIAAARQANTGSIGVLTKIGMRYKGEMAHAGVTAMCYEATREEYQLDETPYVLS